ncbi:pseudouridine synthase [Hyaloraphidium curvatum]|nr:pseudouridine synthase [Hyaloraphidium curvatum]
MDCCSCKVAADGCTRYSDFMVHEIGRDGNVVHLTALEPAVDNAEQEEAALVPNQPENNPFDGLEVIGVEALKAVQLLWETKPDPKAARVEPVTTDPIEDKAVRTSVHDLFRKRFNGFFDTSTKDGRVVVTIRGAGGKGAYRSRTTRREEYCEFVMYKENKDTMEAVGIVAKLARCPMRSFSFAGTKDKRAVTSQRVTAHKFSATTLADLNRKLIGIRLGNFKYVSKPLQLGQLDGNRFTLVLRNVQTESETTLAEALQALADRGFVNYFGLQRFGTGPIATHAVGREMLQGKWKGAVDLILQPKENDFDDVKEARALYQKHAYAAAARKLPKRFTAERSILEFFAERGNDHESLGALMKIPRTLRMMYLHAYQSYVWNVVASYRLKEHGMAAALGDLVRVGTSAAKEAGDIDGVIGSDVDLDFGGAADNVEEGSTTAEVKYLESEDEARTYTIFDVVLPLPGHRVIYPANCADKYREAMAADGLDPFRMERPQRELSLTGSYRNIMSRADGLTWKTVRYSDASSNLCATDLDKLKGRTDEELQQQTGEWLAVVMQFSLQPSSYATMLLRELTKQSSEISFQAGLSRLAPL